MNYIELIKKAVVVTKVYKTVEWLLYFLFQSGIFGVNLPINVLCLLGKMYKN